MRRSLGMEEFSLSLRKAQGKRKRRRGRGRGRASRLVLHATCRSNVAKPVSIFNSIGRTSLLFVGVLVSVASKGDPLLALAATSSPRAFTVKGREDRNKTVTCSRGAT